MRHRPSAPVRLTELTDFHYHNACLSLPSPSPSLFLFLSILPLPTYRPFSVDLTLLLQPPPLPFGHPLLLPSSVVLNHAFLKPLGSPHYGENAVHTPGRLDPPKVVSAEKLPRLSRPHAPNAPTSYCCLSTANDDIGVPRFISTSACYLALSLSLLLPSFSLCRP